MATTGIGLNQPLIATGQARTYFFNGRLLSAEDLQREQTLREAGQRRLAQLLGCGIERGLNVGWSAGSSELTVSAGLGVTPSGELIEADSFLLDLAAAASAPRPGRFGDCAAAFDNGGALAGLHLLVLAPAWIGDGRAPTLLGEVGACNRNVELPAVRARLVPLRAPAGASVTDLRNRLAVALLAPVAGGADRMLGWWPTTVAPTLAADDLPIAVLQINLQAKVEWADPDAARRRVSAPPGNAADALWPHSRRTEMEAFAQQFAAQLLGSGALPLASAATTPPESAAFPLLPPLLLLDAAMLARWRAVFGELENLALAPEILLGREGFSQALEGGLNGEPVARDAAVAQLYRLYRQGEASGTGQWLLRLRDGADPDNTAAASNDKLQHATRNERTSARVAAIAGRALHNPNSTQEEHSLAASALTQAPDKPQNQPARKRTPRKPA